MQKHDIRLLHICSLDLHPSRDFDVSSIMQHPDPAVLGKFSPEYLAENEPGNIVPVCIAFCVVQSVFVALFFISRHLQRTVHGIEVWLLMPLAYLFSMAQSIMGISE